MTDFLSKLQGPLEPVLASLPTERYDLIALGYTLRGRIQIARDAGERPIPTDVERLIGVMHVLQEQEREAEK